MKNGNIWRIISFAGWFLTFLGTGFLLLFMVSFVQEEILSGVFLTLAGLFMAITGEYMLSLNREKIHRYVWEAVSLGGIFSLSAGLLWLVMRSAIMRSYLGIGFVLITGIALILIGETRIASEKPAKKRRKKR